MVQEWCCPKGHRWQHPSSVPKNNLQTLTQCPVCGAGGSLTVRADANGAELDPNHPTLPGPKNPVHQDSTVAPDATAPPRPATLPEHSRPSLGATAAFVPTTANSPANGTPAASPHGQADSNRGTVLDPRQTSPARANPPRLDLDKMEGTAAQMPETKVISSNLPHGGTPIEAPTVATGYEIIGLLGRGAMGVVYKARQKGLNRLVALKMILAGEHAGDHDLARFQAEAEAVAQLQHTHIVQIFEVGQRDGKPFFSLEYVDGGTLDQKIGGKPMAPRLAAEIVQKLAHGMHFAHQRGIIHRDIKPGNILMTRDGIPKISDFGLAKFLGSDSKRTGTGSILGTPSYMAPEQAQGKVNELSAATDVYALGAVLYDALTGRPPFAGESVLDTLMQVEKNDPVPVTRLQPKVPADLETICLKCLEKDPNKRYHSADAMAEDIGRYLRGEPIQARPVSVVERVVKWARRRPAVAALLAALLLFIVGGFFAMMAMWLKAEESRRLANVAAENAETKRLEAIDAEKRAKNAGEQVQASYEKSVRTLYAAQMNLAQDAWLEAKITRLKELLENQDPKKTANLNLRGFEFNYLLRLLQSDYLTLRSHTQNLRCVAFRPPGYQQMASGSADGNVILWFVQNNAGRFRLFRDHQGSVRHIAFSKDGRLMASTGEDGLVVVRDLESEEPPRRLQGHRQAVVAAAFRPDGKQLATADDEGKIITWDPATGKQVSSWHAHLYTINDLAFHPEGTSLASASMDRTVRLWDPNSSKSMGPPLPHKHWATAVAFSPNGKHLASGGWDPAVRLWDAATGKLAYTFPPAPGPVRELNFSADSGRLGARCVENDLGVIVFDVGAREVLHRLAGAPGMYRSVAFSADGQQLASVNFDLLTREKQVLPGPDAMLAVSEGSDPLTFAGACVDGSLILWNVTENDNYQARPGHKGPVRAISFSPHLQLWATGGEDGRIGWWPAKGEPRFIEGHERWILAAAWDKAGATLATGGADGTVALWHHDKKEPLARWKAHPDQVLGLAFDPRENRLATIGGDRLLKLWDLKTRQELPFLGKNATKTYAVAFSPDGRFLATGGADRAVKLWDLKNPSVPVELRGHTEAVTCLAFTYPEENRPPDSLDGVRLASGSADRTVKIWDVSTGQETLTLRGHTHGVTGLAFSRDNYRLVSTSWDGSALVWDASPQPKK